MKLTIDTTPEQDEALTALNLLSNPKDQPPVEEFAISELISHLNSLIVNTKTAKLDEAKAKLEAVVTKLTSQDLAQLTAVAEKYSDSQP